MASVGRLRWGITTAGASVVVMVVLILAGALNWYRPFLTQSSQPVASTPAPTALFKVTEFAVPAGKRACMSSVTVTPDSNLAYLLLRPPKPTPRGGPPIQLTLTAPGYRASLLVPGGYGGGAAELPITPPRRPVVATACYFNLGPGPVLLDGTSEPRTRSRSTVEIDGHLTPGDIALIFYSSKPQSLLDRLGSVFTHASNLTDGLVPVWGVWLVALLTALGIPAAVIFAFYRAVAEDSRQAL